MKINEVIGIKQVNDIRQVSDRPIADQLKHDLAKNILAKEIMTRSNIVKPSSDDIQAASQQVDTELTKVKYEHDQEVEQALRKQERQQRRRT